MPELPAAQRTLCRAQRRHGWAATFDATAAATAICIDLRFWATHHPLWMRWEQRLDLLMPASYQRSMFMAVIFPEVAALAAVLAMPGWQAVAVSGTPADVNRFLHAANNALGCADPPNRHDISDTVMICIRDRAGAPPLQPVAAYPDTSHRGDGTPRVADGRRIAGRSPTRFDRDRRAPASPAQAHPCPTPTGPHRPTPTS